MLQTKIDMAKLNDYYIGMWVEYHGSAGKVERGRIKSWTNINIFVVYKCGGDWRNFKDYTAECTSPDALTLSECRCYNPGQDDGENTCWQHHDCQNSDCTHQDNDDFCSDDSEAYDD